jgi:hypothetical protein
MLFIQFQGLKLIKIIYSNSVDKCLFLKYFINFTIKNKCRFIIMNGFDKLHLIVKYKVDKYDNDRLINK